MTTKRRKEIEKIISSLEQVKERISILHMEEFESYQNLPDTLQESEKGENILLASEALKNAMDSSSDIDEIITYLEEALDY